jgi:hypothetical protein
MNDEFEKIIDRTSITHTTIPMQNGATQYSMIEGYGLKDSNADKSEMMGSPKT